MNKELEHESNSNNYRACHPLPSWIMDGPKRKKEKQKQIKQTAMKILKRKRPVIITSNLTIKAFLKDRIIREFEPGRRIHFFNKGDGILMKDRKFMCEPALIKSKKDVLCFLNIDKVEDIEILLEKFVFNNKNEVITLSDGTDKEVLVTDLQLLIHTDVDPIVCEQISRGLRVGLIDEGIEIQFELDKDLDSKKEVCDCLDCKANRSGLVKALNELAGASISNIDSIDSFRMAMQAREQAKSNSKDECDCLICRASRETGKISELFEKNPLEPFIKMLLQSERSKTFVSYVDEIKTAESTEKPKQKFSNAKLGDKVYHIRYGQGKIQAFAGSPENGHDIIKAEFQRINGKFSVNFFSDGRQVKTDALPSLYHSQPTITEE